MAAFSTQAQHERIQRTQKHSRAFIVETIALFIFLVISLSIVCLLLFASADRARQSDDLEQAVTLASNAAERFSANPLDRNLSFMNGNLTVISQVTPQELSQGILYQANIVVSNDHAEIYQLETSRYVGKAG